MCRGNVVVKPRMLAVLKQSTTHAKVLISPERPNGPDDLYNFLHSYDLPTNEPIAVKIETHIFLSRLGLERRHVDWISNILADAQLGVTKLELSGCGIDGQDALKLASARQAQARYDTRGDRQYHLQHLDLSHNRIETSAVDVVTALLKQSPITGNAVEGNLKLLSLAHNDIGGSDVVTIVDMVLALKSTVVETVDLHGNMQDKKQISSIEQKIKQSGTKIKFILVEPTVDYPKPAQDVVNRLLKTITKH